MAVILPVSMSLSLTSCGSIVQSYRLRFWEKYRINAEQCYKKSQYSQARTKAVEALALAEGFGDSDFRLGVSLCDLGDIDKAVGKNKAAEDHYKRAIKVFEAAGSRAAEAAMKAKSANSSTGTSNLSSATSKAENDSDEAMMCKLIREDLANGLTHLADLYAIQEKYSEAAKCFDEAANLYQSMVGGNRWLLDDCAMGQELVTCLVGLAQVSLAQKEPDAAAQAYHRALDYAVAAQCPEHVLVDIRDAYLELLQDQGRSKEANQLLADIDWQKSTSAGVKAYYQKNIPEADTLLHRAFMDAQQSIFSERRMMKSLYNLLSVLVLEDKPAEVEQCRMLAHKYVLSRNVRFDQDYDSMLTFLANYSLNAKNPYQAIDSLKQQQIYRLNEYGPLSIQICETLALLGSAQLYAGQKDEAEKSAKAVYEVIKKNYM
ncbi:MAG: tetratricopeptide repeat protein, partial [Candidatus Obscuribacterales bacterium]|nr:tetratricopeptide repeat protein [Candidatus Obscuribacterales bacterium]